MTLTVSGDVRLGSEVEHHITARQFVAPRARVGQLAPHGLGAQRRDLCSRCLTSNQNTHRMPLVEEAKRTSTWPMNPEPPVTNACAMNFSLRSVRAPLACLEREGVVG